MIAKQLEMATRRFEKRLISPKLLHLGSHLNCGKAIRDRTCNRLVNTCFGLIAWVTVVISAPLITLAQQGGPPENFVRYEHQQEGDQTNTENN
jgi:hypothetical protein